MRLCLKADSNRIHTFAPLRAHSMADIRNRASFDFIRYSNCWEDADLLVEALAPQPGARLLSIASAGDNSFSLLTCNPELVAAVDLNPSQLALLELKRESFRRMEYEETLRFLGFAPATGNERAETYRLLCGNLSAEARGFWDANPELIERGMIHVGKFERYFSIFRKNVLPLVHNRKNVTALQEKKSLEEQERFYSRRWDTWRWRAMFRIFFSRAVMGRLGRDPELFRYVDGSVADRILDRTRHALTALSVHDNPYVRYILEGEFGDALPPYMRREHYRTIRDNLGSLIPVCGTTDDAIARIGTGFDGMNLSDIFEYMTEAETKETGERLAAALRTGGRAVYWNMLAPRSLARLIPERLRRLDEQADRLFAEDRAFFYQALHIDQAL